MSKHWNPEDEIARWTVTGEAPRPAKRSWPQGATVGLALVAASCLAVGLVLYQFAGPSDVVDDRFLRR